MVRQRGHGGETQAFDNYPGPDRGLALPPQFVLHRGDVKIITDKMAADGKLDWDAPAGRWHVLRVGYTSTARQNAPANVEGRGLECDKFDPAAVRFHLEQYVGKLHERYGATAAKAFSVFETDSWECGIQNWTAGLEGRFKQEFGYNLEIFLPLICEGCLIEGYDASERMLWDWRRCLADQIAAYYGEVGAVRPRARPDLRRGGLGATTVFIRSVGLSARGRHPNGRILGRRRPRQWRARG